ncbi:KAP family P-loop NTPase fold protein [Edaphocola aurantiacus]|uniref:KAP family P-loop NTPase fold protein n=1 Tax=Edaphocola aurantiacus TaxID=2601682 RepID=UPI001C947836|nr:P-loop NTPase fold protein [Edaphocola aurantiacus]
MKIKHQTPDIPKDNPFQNCKLKREQYAIVLTDIVKVYSDGFVLAVNNEWGAGKTTFVKMWQQSLINEEFDTLYFNAWENDFDSNPLVAIMSELNKLTNKDNKAIFKNVLEKGAILAKNVLPAALKAFLKRYMDTDEMLDALENTTKGATEIFEEEIKEYTQKKESIIDFRTQLENFIDKTGNPRPIVFFIDELDRCRPHYAVEVLEQMKHFFSVPGITFVLSIDKTHLAASVRGFYGSEQINTDEYLRRFIDLEYNIPKPSCSEYVKYLYEYYSFDEFFASTERKTIRDLEYESLQFQKMADFLFTSSKATLRQQEKILGQTRLILKSFNEKAYTFSGLLLFLIFIKTLNNDLFKRIEDQLFTLQELSDAFSDVMVDYKGGISGLNLVYIQALLLQFYNNNKEYETREKIFIDDGERFERVEITSKIEQYSYNSTLTSCLDDIRRHYAYSGTQLKYLLNRINLIQGIV